MKNNLRFHEFDTCTTTAHDLLKPPLGLCFLHILEALMHLDDRTLPVSRHYSYLWLSIVIDCDNPRAIGFDDEMQ